MKILPRIGPGSQQQIKGACYEKSGCLVPNLASALAILRSAPELFGCFAFDQMLNAPIVVRTLPGHTSESGKFPRPLSDVDVSQTQEWLQHFGLTRIGKETCRQAIDKCASECPVHPVRKYLEAIVWDGKERLKTWLSYYLGVKQTPYSETIGRYFFISLVARIFIPGCQVDYMLILEGAQGYLKSSACGVIAGEWFSDNLPQICVSKDAQQHLQGKWLIEIGELAAMSRTEAEELKSFITRRIEQYRPPYGRKDVFEPRQCVFIGTTNREVYLKDETGGRRFWPVKVDSIDLGALANDRDQLFSEAVHLFKSGERWWPDKDCEEQHIRPQQDLRFEEDPWHGKIADFVADKGRVTVFQVAHDGLFIETPRVGTSDARRISCSVPMYNGTESYAIDKEGTWARFFTGAPARRRRFVERYNIVKRA